MNENESASAVAPWNPFSDFDLVSPWPRLGQLPAFRSLNPEGNGIWPPALDISENDNHFVITMELAGAKKEDVAVESHDNVLTIRGEKRSERSEEKEQRRYVERSFGTFSRSFTLPASADPDSVDAGFNDGVLTIKITKREDSKPRAIAVK